MRKEAKNQKNVRVAQTQRYHETNYTNNANYAFQGFVKNQYYNSDRAIALDENFNAPGLIPKAWCPEIEVETNGSIPQELMTEILEKVVFIHFPKYLFKTQRDGSIRGVEIIPQLMTKSFIRNHYRDFKLMYDTYFQAFNFSCASARCGMHINISNANFGTSEEKQNDNIRKLYYIVNKYFKFFCRLFNRDYNNTNYCGVMPIRNSRYTNEIEYCQNLNLENFDSNHYVCLNLGHYTEGRIELRLVGGQKNYACFRNTFECAFKLIDGLKNTNWNKLSLVNIFKGCNQYVVDRIKSHCLSDNLISIEEYEEIRTNAIYEELL